MPHCYRKAKFQSWHCSCCGHSQIQRQGQSQSQGAFHLSNSINCKQMAKPITQIRKANRKAWDAAAAAPLLLLPVLLCCCCCCYANICHQHFCTLISLVNFGLTSRAQCIKSERRERESERDGNRESERDREGDRAADGKEDSKRMRKGGWIDISK